MYKIACLLICIVCSLQGSHIDESVWEKTGPYLLPEDHPAKEKLDQIFSKSRVILNIDTMKKAGFIKPKPRKSTHLIVTKHPDLPGYVFKIYLDAQRLYKRVPAYELWILRVQGVEMIRKEIEKRGWGALFTTPKKWLYPLPEHPSPPKEFTRKNFILIEEDMDILSSKENLLKWKSETVDRALLDKVCSLLQDLGLSDCAKPDNIPFCKDGKIAFIDTQTFHSWPVRWDKMHSSLSKSMKKYWKQRTKRKCLNVKN